MQGRSGGLTAKSAKVGRLSGLIPRLRVSAIKPFDPFYYEGHEAHQVRRPSP